MYFNLTMFQTYACSRFKVFKLDCVYVVVVAVLLLSSIEGSRLSITRVHQPIRTSQVFLYSAENRKNGRRVFLTS